VTSGKEQEDLELRAGDAEEFAGGYKHRKPGTFVIGGSTESTSGKGTPAPADLEPPESYMAGSPEADQQS